MDILYCFFAFEESIKSSGSCYEYWFGQTIEFEKDFPLFEKSILSSKFLRIQSHIEFSNKRRQFEKMFLDIHRASVTKMYPFAQKSYQKTFDFLSFIW